MRRRVSSYQHDATDGGLPMFAAGLRNAPYRSRKPPPHKEKCPDREIGAQEPLRAVYAQRKIYRLAAIKATSKMSSTSTASAEPITEPSSGFTTFILHRLRVAALRAQLVANEIAAAGVALKAGFIDGETALAMLDETGLLPLIEASS
jgi:hypothetical protein